jgi:hypothetical protein
MSSQLVLQFGIKIIHIKDLKQIKSYYKYLNKKKVMNVSQALKKKNKLAIELKKQYAIAQKFNSQEAGNPRRYSVQAALDNLPKNISGDKARKAIELALKVGDKKVTPQAFSKFLDSQRKQYIFRFGSGIIETLLNKKEFVLITVNGVADGLLISKALEDEGIIVNKDTVNYYILNSPTFKTADNKFDDIYFRTYLAQMGISEEGYIAEQISIINSKFLLEFLSLSEISFQENLVKTLIASEKQTREILVKRIPISENNIGEIPEKEVLQYYIKNKGNYIQNHSFFIQLLL